MHGINMDKEGIIMDDSFITMAHGAGGLKSRELVEKMMLPAFDNKYLRQMHDGAKLLLKNNIAFTTDSYVVKPLFFRGGNIGKLAICGTVNDLSMTGAIPRYLSVGMIIEEGFPLSDLQTIVNTMREAAQEAGIYIVTGDTKVVDKNSGDGIFINTAGVGELIEGSDIAPQNVRPNMDIIVSGYLGDHAASVMAVRHGLELPENIKSDCAPLNGLVKEVLQAAPQVAVMRDATRGGAAAVLNEIAEQARVGIIIDEEKIPVRKEVKGFCDILGFDPLYLANEGKMIVFVNPKDTAAVLQVMHENRYGKNACMIGTTNDKSCGEVGLRTIIGGIRIVDMPAGEQIPRIC